VILVKWREEIHWHRVNISYVMEICIIITFVCVYINILWYVHGCLIYKNTSYYKKVCEDVTVYWYCEEKSSGFRKYTTKLYDAFLSCSFWSWWSISKHILKHAAHFATNKWNTTTRPVKCSLQLEMFGITNHAASAISFAELRHERDVWPIHSNPKS